MDQISPITKVEFSSIAVLVLIIAIFIGLFSFKFIFKSMKSFMNSDKENGSAILTFIRGAITQAIFMVLIGSIALLLGKILGGEIQKIALEVVQIYDYAIILMVILVFLILSEVK